MDWIKLFVQRRILASIIQTILGAIGAGAAGPDAQAQFVNALLTFVPALLNLWSYLKKLDSVVIDRSLAAALLPVLGLVFRQLGVDVPDEVLQGAYAAGAALVASTLGLWSRFSTNPVGSPSGALGTPNP